jgi:hypothetical protein
MGTQGQRLRELRGETDRAELSRLTGVPKTTIQTIEEQPQSKSKWLPTLARYFNVNLEWLTTGRGPKLVGEPRSPSHPTTPDPDILHEAFTLIAFDEEMAGKYLPRNYARRLSELYSRIASDGGKLTNAHTRDFEREVFERRQNRQGVARGTEQGGKRGSGSGG